jgi:hypothetical protein
MESRYVLKTTKDDLYSKGFRYNKLMSDETDFYSLRFPVHKYGKHTTLECELTVELQTGDIIINVFSCGTRERYTPFYVKNYGRYEILNSVNKIIEEQLKKIGAKEVKENE